MLKKTLAAVGVLAVILVAGVLIAAANKPDTFRVQRGASIKAPPEKIAAVLTDFRGWGAWSPWEKLDPAMKRSYSGAEKGKGAVYAWEGNRSVGAGRMEITDVAPSRVELDLDFVKPFPAHNKVEFALEGNGDTTRVSWTMQGPIPYVAKIVHVVFDMDGMVGGQFETGLANLKALTEK
jgi:Polyketide cyclase / dehydrase and lipid transport